MLFLSIKNIIIENNIFHFMMFYNLTNDICNNCKFLFFVFCFCFCFCFLCFVFCFLFFFFFFFFCFCFLFFVFCFLFFVFCFLFLLYTIENLKLDVVIIVFTQINFLDIHGIVINR